MRANIIRKKNTTINLIRNRVVFYISISSKKVHFMLCIDKTFKIVLKKRHQFKTKPVEKSSHVLRVNNEFA